jgi:putative addiction module component (TIGR02574 family)
MTVSAEPQVLPVHEWQKQELERRQAAHEQNPQAAIPWDEALKQLRQDLAK